MTYIDQYENIDLMQKSYALIACDSYLLIMEAQTGIPNTPVNQKENMVQAFLVRLITSHCFIDFEFLNIRQGGHSNVSKNSRTIQEHFKHFVNFQEHN